MNWIRKIMRRTNETKQRIATRRWDRKGLPFSFRCNWIIDSIVARCWISTCKARLHVRWRRHHQRQQQIEEKRKIKMKKTDDDDDATSYKYVIVAFSLNSYLGQRSNSATHKRRCRCWRLKTAEKKHKSDSKWQQMNTKYEKITDEKHRKKSKTKTKTREQEADEWASTTEQSAYWHECDRCVRAYIHAINYNYVYYFFDIECAR